MECSFCFQNATFIVHFGNKKHKPQSDQVINLCEMKYSLSEYAIDAEYEQKFRNKKSAFINTTNTRKAVHLTMVT